MVEQECEVCGRDTRAGGRYFVGRKRVETPEGGVTFLCKICRHDGLSIPSGAGSDEVSITIPAPHGHPMSH